MSEDGAVVPGALRGERVDRRGFRDVTRVVLIRHGVFAPSVQDAHEDGLLLRNHRVRSEFHDA